VLSFRLSADDLLHFDRRHLIYGLLVTWAVGLGRYWDHPDPYLVQSLGLGSLLVLGGLGLLLYIALLPLRPAGWSLLNLYTFLSLTALPAVLYAIPVERFLSAEAARSANFWFLAVVAIWRVSMLGRYLACRTDLSGGVLTAALLLPLALIVVILTLLNLEKAVFDFMGGVRDSERTPNDEAYELLFLLSFYSFLASPVLAITYGVAVWKRYQARRAAA
jgi:hypothetical protein